MILIGEIRDEQTMEIAMQAAQTGHLVISTVHANNSHETIDRLIGLGADPIKLADTLRLVLAQRLLKCYKGPSDIRPLTTNEREWLTYNGLELQFIDECTSVEATHRTGVIEAIVIDDLLKPVIRKASPSSEIYKVAAQQLQFESLVVAGLRAVHERGSKLKDCMSSLESNPESIASPCLRVVLSKKYGLTLSQVSLAIDTHLQQRELELPSELEAHLIHHKRGSIDA